MKRSKKKLAVAKPYKTLRNKMSARAQQVAQAKALKMLSKNCGAQEI